MMRFLLTHLRAKLMVLVLLPLAAGAALTALLVYRQNQVVLGLAPLTTTSRLGAALEDLIHALEAERSATALHLSARGQGATQDLRALRAASDRAAQAFTALLPALATATGAEDTAAALRRLPDLRREAESTRSAPALVEAYSALIASELRLRDLLIQQAAGTPLETRYHALSALMHGMEQADQERALLANAYSNLAYAPGMRDRLLALAAVQEAQTQAFLRAAPPAWREAQAHALRGPFDAEYRRLRDPGAAAPSGNLQEGDPFLWYRVSSERLAALKRLEEGFSRELLTEAEGLETSARRLRLALIAGSLLFGILVLAWTHVTGEAVLRPIQALEEGLARLRQGDLSVRLPIQGQDETARMMEAFNTTCDQLGQVARRLKEAAHRVAGGAQGLTASADQVSGSTQALARSAFAQRQAAEQVATAMVQLSASVVQLEDTLAAARGEGRRAVELARAAMNLGQEARKLVEGIHARSNQAVQASAAISELRHLLTQAPLANLPSEGVRKALERSIQASELAADLVRQNGSAVEEGHSRLDDLAAALEGTLAALMGVDQLAHEIGLVAREQAAASREVSARMQETSKGTGDVQLAAAQLANTAPEVHLTSQTLAGVAHGLASTADAFTYA